MKTFEFTHIKEGIGSTHQGILEHIPQVSKVNTQARKQSMVGQAEDTIYHRQYTPVERLTRLLNMKDDVG